VSRPPGTESPPSRLDLDRVERWLTDVYVAAEGASLRTEDRRKAVQLLALLEEIARAAARVSAQRELQLVDAAAGKVYAGLAAAKLLFEPAGRAHRVTALEREPSRLATAERVSNRGGSAAVSFKLGDVDHVALWPEEPDLVVALHACGPAADAIIDRAVERRARHLLLVPCCTGAGVPAAAPALAAAEALGIPRQAPVRRRFVQVFIDAERTLRLEAAGYQTEVGELVPPTVTPHNLLWRARRVAEPRRAAAAASTRAGLLSPPSPAR